MIVAVEYEPNTDDVRILVDSAGAKLICGILTELASGGKVDSEAMTSFDGIIQEKITNRPNFKVATGLTLGFYPDDHPDVLKWIDNQATGSTSLSRNS